MSPAAGPTTPSCQYDLLLSWQQRDIAAFKSALKVDGVKPNFIYPEEGYRTVLEAIAECVSPESHEFASALLNEGAMPNLMNSISGKAPIHVAAGELNVKVLEVLIEGGADVNMEDSAGNTPLHIVVRKVKPIDEERQKTCLNLLLERPDIDLNYHNRKGLSPVHLAFQQGSLPVLRRLLQLGSLIDVDFIPPGASKLSLREEILTKHPELAEKLPPTAQPEWALKMDGSKLFNLLYMGQEQRFVTALKKELQDQNQRKLLIFDDGLYTLLQYSVKMGYLQAANALLQAGADVDQAEPMKLSPLQLAAHEGDLEMLKLILSHHPDLTQDSNGETALHTLTKLLEFSERHYDCLQHLLTTKIDVNAADYFGRTALHYASYFPNSKAVRLLLDSGANMFLMDNTGESACKNLSRDEIESFLDSRIAWNSYRGENCRIKIDLNFLNPNLTCPVITEATVLDDDEQNTRGFETEAKKLSQISETPNLVPLLGHPVIKAFISHKWVLIRPYFYAELLLYLIFIILLYSYSVLGVADDPTAISIFLKLVLVIFLILRYVQTLLAATAAPYAFIFNPQRWMSCLLTIMTTTVVANDCSKLFLQSPSKSNLCTNLSSTTSLLAGAQFLLIVGEHPKFSSSFSIMKKIVKRCLQVLFIYLVPLLAFVVSWHLLSRSCVDEYCDSLFFGGFLFPIPFREESRGPSVEEKSRVPFLIFIFLLIIIFTHNLALGISDCKQILENKEAHALREQLKLISSFEETFISSPRARLRQLAKYTPFYFEMPNILNKMANRILFFAKGDGYLVLLANQDYELTTVRQRSKKPKFWNPPTHFARKWVIDMEKRVIVAQPEIKNQVEDEGPTANEKIDVLMQRSNDLSDQLATVNEKCKQVEQLLIQSLAVLSLHNSQ